MTRFDLVIMVDWSADSKPGPIKPKADAIWLAFGTRDDRPPPEYHRTRASCIERVAELASTHRQSTLIGFDFALGYPTLATACLPTGRALCRHLAERVSDDAGNRNNRFEAAEQLNLAIAASCGWPEGPFWGRPAHLALPGLRATLPRDCPAPHYRAIEQQLRSDAKAIQSAWKLAYPASVGSQTLLGLPAIHRLLTRADLADRAHLWPFEPAPDRADFVTIAEIWPGLLTHDHVEHDIRDARQVIAARDHFLAGVDLAITHPAARSEGWILGVPG